MAQDSSLVFVFFDIGNTLGRADAPGHLVAFTDTKPLLRAMRDTLGLRVGVITNLPAEMDRVRIRSILDEAGLGEFLDPEGLVTNHDAKADKPDPEIYRFAAGRVGAEIGRCLYIGEDAEEVRGALSSGMQAIRKPVPPG